MKRGDLIKVSDNCYIIGKGNYKKVKAMAIKADLKKLEDCMITKHGVITITTESINMKGFETDAETQLKSAKEILTFGIEELQRSLTIARAQESHDERPYEYLVQ